MIITATAPPAIHAPEKPCADYRPVNLNVGYSTTAISPDCRWVVMSIGDDDIESGKNATLFRLPKLKEGAPYRAFVVERATGRIVYHFEMERSASIHWLKDDRYLVINYFEGSGSVIPLLFTLRSAPLHGPADLSARIWPSVLKHAQISDKRPYAINRWTYHYYVNFIEDTGDRLIISAQPWYTQNGAEGPGIVKCYIYSISKTTLRYRFVREDDIDTCPRNADEKWN